MNFGVFDRRQGIRSHGQTGNPARHGAQDIAVVQRHFDALIRVFVVHVVNAIQSFDIGCGEPIHHFFKLSDDFVVVQYVGLNRLEAFGHDHTGFFIHTTVDRVQQGFGQIRTRAKKLHLFTNAHGRYAARDAVVIAPLRTHQIIVFVLNRAGVDRHFGTEIFETAGQLG